jgi:hypothetical protein
MMKDHRGNGHGDTYRANAVRVMDDEESESTDR